MTQIDINCDLGEGFPDDAKLMSLVSSVNIACGGHAGDDDTMRSALRVGVAASVNLGAHLGYADRANFGRVAMPLTPRAVVDLIANQAGHLMALARAEGARLSHVKPHGALYHAAVQNREVASAIVEGIRLVSDELAVVCPAISALATAARDQGLRCVAEAFVDRRYQSDGTLVPRSLSGATIDDVAAAAAQALSIVCQRQVTTTEGQTIPVCAETLCVHGDGAQALRVLAFLRQTLAARNVRVACF